LNVLLKRLNRLFLIEKLNNVQGWILCIALAVYVSFIASKSMTAGESIIGLFFCIIGGCICLLSARLGLYIIVAFSFFAILLSRFFFNDTLPSGLILDITVLAIVLGLLIRKKELKAVISSFAASPVTILILVVAGYSALEFFNPNAMSFNGSFQAFRKILNLLLLFFISYYVFNSLEAIKKFIYFLFIVSALAGLYGCIQEWYGLFNFEREWLLADAHRYGLIVIAGHIRVFSTMTDPAAFGMIMTSCAVFFIGLLSNRMTALQRLLVIAGIVFMILGMTYSGTRTANAMLVAGVGFYLLLTIQRRSSLIIAVVSTVILVGALYAPISNPSLNRFRTTFQASEDPSYKLRVKNRKSIQPYIYSHPMGGGLGTTGAVGEIFHPGHPLAGFQPDSGYLKKALETGWIGLILFFVLYFLVLKRGINAYFKTEDTEAKNIIAATTSALFTFYVGEYAQVAIGQISDVVVYYPLIAILLRIDTFKFKTNL